MTQAIIKISGDASVSVVFPGQISLENNLKVRTLQFILSREMIPGIVEVVPAYCSLMIHYDPCLISYQEVEHRLQGLLSSETKIELPQGTVTEIPVLYGGDAGPDLEEVASYEGITPEEVIRRHSEKQAFIYMIAFAPGLPYIGSIEKTFSVPRRTSPRVRLPAGSVTIWESQTTIFPVDQPGGWNVIGKTPLKLVDWTKEEQPFLLRSGDWIQFRPIDQKEYQIIETQVKEGTYIPRVMRKVCTE